VVVMLVKGQGPVGLQLTRHKVPYTNRSISQTSTIISSTAITRLSVAPRTPHLLSTSLVSGKVLKRPEPRVARGPDHATIGGGQSEQNALGK
jgi:hypothetical protein